MTCTYFCMHHVLKFVIQVIEEFIIPICEPTVDELWLLALYHWKVSIVVGIVVIALMIIMVSLDMFDSRMAYFLALHTALMQADERWARETAQAASVERIFPTPGGYDYSKAYKLNHRADDTNSEDSGANEMDSEE
jgi:hypothetical protein